MYHLLLWQHWKKTLRSRYFSQGWGVKILIGFLALYFGGIFLILGIALPEILAETHPSEELLTQVFSGFILHYLLMDLAMRFFLQDLNVLTIQHYLIQPLKKKVVINYLLRGSVFNFFNLLPLFILIPFSIRVVADEYGAFNSIMWFASIFLLVLANHFLAIYIKRALAIKFSLFLLFAGVVGGLLIADFAGYLSLQDYSTAIFAPLAENWWLIVIPLLLLILFYRLNFSFLKKHTHLDLWKANDGKAAGGASFSFLESRGITGAMVANELKLITRNKRTKSILTITLLFSLYGLIFYTQPEYDGSWGMFLFVGIFMTGIFMINYGQFLVGWESSYFDGILTRSYSMLDFYRAKFWLLAVSCVITYILSIPYVYFGMKALYINTACFIYNIGINTFILLYASTYQKKRIDLGRSSAFNYQGTSVIQFVIMIPLLLVPILIFQAFNIFDKPIWGLIFLSILGLFSLSLSKYWFQAIINNFEEKKHRNAQGFREKS